MFPLIKTMILITAFLMALKGAVGVNAPRATCNCQDMAKQQQDFGEALAKLQQDLAKQKQNFTIELDSLLQVLGEALRKQQSEFNTYKSNTNLALNYALSNNNEVRKRNGEIRLDLNLLRIQMCNLTDDVKAAESKVQNQITATESKVQNQITAAESKLQNQITDNKNENNKLVTRMMNVEQQTTTLSRKVAFHVQRTPTYHASHPYYVTYDKQYTNIGNAFDGRTFHAPVHGLYYFGVCVRGVKGEKVQIAIMQNIRGIKALLMNDAIPGKQVHTCVTAVLWLEVGWRVWVWGRYDASYIFFNGFLIIPA